MRESRARSVLVVDDQDTRPIASRVFNRPASSFEQTPVRLHLIELVQLLELESKARGFLFELRSKTRRGDARWVETFQLLRYGPGDGGLGPRCAFSRVVTG